MATGCGIIFPHRRRSDRRNKPLLGRLMKAIQDGDDDVCEVEIRNMNKYDLNRRAKISSDVYENILCTPVLAAVVNKREKVLKLLLDKKVPVDKICYFGCKEDYIMFALTPLLHAVQSNNKEMASMLVESGAHVQLKIPGQRYREEEGRFYQMQKYIYILDLVMVVSSDFEMFKLVFKNADVNLCYGEKQQTCLHYWIGLQNFPNYAKKQLHMVQHGAKMSPCFSDPNVYQPFIREKSVFRKADNTCYCMSIYVYYLMHCQDYVHVNNRLYACFKLLSESLNNQLEGKNICNNSRQMFDWLKDYGTSPSTLTEICKCVIRQSIPRVSPEKCYSLPVPLKYKKYLNLEYIQDSVCSTFLFENDNNAPNVQM